MSDIYSTGIRPIIDAHIKKRSEEIRSYGDYWSASSAGYCMRLNILKQLKVPPVPEVADSKPIQQRVFDAGHTFHEWAQKITEEAGISIAQELELQDEDLMVRGHIDDLVLVKGAVVAENAVLVDGDGQPTSKPFTALEPHRLILYDYKTAHSEWFHYKGKRGIGHYHAMQLATYMYLLRSQKYLHDYELYDAEQDEWVRPIEAFRLSDLTEARILHISKDDLRLAEDQLIWSPAWEKAVVDYWRTLRGYWDNKVVPKCTCLEHDGGFMGRRSKKGKIYCDYFLNDTCCNIEWFKQFNNNELKGWKYG